MLAGASVELLDDGTYVRLVNDRGAGQTYKAVTANFTPGPADWGKTFFLNLSGNIVCTLDPTGLPAGWEIECFNPLSSAYSCAFTPNNAKLLDGCTSRSGAAGTRVKILWDGTKFHTSSGYYTYRSGSQTVAFGSEIGPFPHNLGGSSNIDIRVRLKLVCVSPEAGYSAGDTVPLENMTNENRGLDIAVNATQVSVAIDAGGIQIENKDGSGSAGSITAAKWNIALFLEAA